MKRPPTPAVGALDVQLFRESISGVRPLTTSTATPIKPKPAPVPRMHLRDEADALVQSRSSHASDAEFNAGEPLAYRSPKVSGRSFLQLKRGQYSVQDEIDLHHLRAADAEEILKKFLTHASREGRRCVRVIHGKGLRSENGPVLKALVDRILRHRGDVLAFSSAPAAQGGMGVALVLLHAPR